MSLKNYRSAPKILFFPKADPFAISSLILIIVFKSLGSDPCSLAHFTKARVSFGRQLPENGPKSLMPYFGFHITSDDIAVTSKLFLLSNLLSWIIDLLSLI